MLRGVLIVCASSGKLLFSHAATAGFGLPPALAPPGQGGEHSLAGLIFAFFLNSCNSLAAASSRDCPPHLVMTLPASATKMVLATLSHQDLPSPLLVALLLDSALVSSGTDADGSGFLVSSLASSLVDAFARKVARRLTRGHSLVACATASTAWLRAWIATDLPVVVGKLLVVAARTPWMWIYLARATDDAEHSASDSVYHAMVPSEAPPMLAPYTVFAAPDESPSIGTQMRAALAACCGCCCRSTKAGRVVDASDDDCNPKGQEGCDVDADASSHPRRVFALPVSSVLVAERPEAGTRYALAGSSLAKLAPELLTKLSPDPDLLGRYQRQRVSVNVSLSPSVGDIDNSGEGGTSSSGFELDVDVACLSSRILVGIPTRDAASLGETLLPEAALRVLEGYLELLEGSRLEPDAVATAVASVVECGAD
ncbi:uncharacterized protein AMSG_03408 [Thecamonas trahens ATCC 50062]|uniref:Uncharacterized protein n=1 Tax=Thecamonas trahens ATCC 50062 TaxID=461836 RepID=A0A0L0D400_THETB|nr:hypothetical protein AMSG_03408 [Thecamonas trahens ATCC 50062]KNC46975.1 hypothetical protein AMSG_03408 [Thecamonas trahens ATCC 50062]|eukprot:XP_013760246.1 hypothetical protein AMSG_03408 [Thecamonas trahens ATCC 50062]